MRKTITASTIYGTAKALATVRKWLAVNRLDDDYWGVTYVALGKEKEIKFDVQDVQVELAKLSKKGLLEINEVPIQLRIQGL